MNASLVIALAALSGSPDSTMPVAAPASPARLRQAVAGGLDYLTDMGLAWRTERQCAACHHGPELLWALGEARAAGFAVNEGVFADLTTWAVADGSPAKVLPAPGEFYHLVPAYMAVAVSAGGNADDATRAGLARFAAYILTQQREDGSWAGAENGRPPLNERPEVITTLSLLALAAPALRDDPSQSQLAAAREKGLAWLAANPPGDGHQEAAMRLILAASRGLPAEELQPFIDDLLNRQDAGGGCRQTPDMDADAFATGQSLYALRLAGVPADHPALQAGAAFLVNTQSADGSWPMKSRPLFNGGGPGANPAPIIFAGTSWGVIGLARCARE